MFAALPAPSLAVSFRAASHFNNLFHALYIARSCSDSCVRESLQAALSIFWSVYVLSQAQLKQISAGGRDFTA